MSTKMIVLDIAGTTVADEQAVVQVFKKSFALHGCEVTDEMVNPLMGYKKILAIEKLLQTLGHPNNKAFTESIHQSFEQEMITYYAQDANVRAMPGAEEVMLYLKRNGMRVCLNTGFTRDIADMIMKKLHWLADGLVDDMIASDEVANGRPDPAMIRKLMARAGVTNPQNVVKVGDTEVDIREGRNAGCALVVAVTTGTFSRKELEAYHPDYILDDLSPLPAILINRA